MRKELAMGRIVLFSFLIGTPLRLLGIFVPALSFLNNLLATAASIWLGTILGLRFQRIEPVPDRPSVRPKASQTGRLASRPPRQLPVLAIVVTWLLYGLLAWDGIARGYLGNLPTTAWEMVGQWIPSIQQLHALGREWPKLHASLLVTPLPLLLLAFLYTDMTSSIARVMASGRREMAIVFLPLLGIFVFFFGLDSRRLGNSFFTYALGSSLLFAGSTYFLALGIRLAGLATGPTQHTAPKKNVEDLAIESLQALTASQSMASTVIPPTMAIQSAIRSLGRLYGIEEQCRDALADLGASPPFISAQVLNTATRLLAISNFSKTEARKEIRNHKNPG